MYLYEQLYTNHLKLLVCSVSQAVLIEGNLSQISRDRVLVCGQVSVLTD